MQRADHFRRAQNVDQAGLATLSPAPSVEEKSSPVPTATGVPAGKPSSSAARRRKFASEPLGRGRFRQLGSRNPKQLQKVVIIILGCKPEDHACRGGRMIDDAACRSAATRHRTPGTWKHVASRTAGTCRFSHRIFAARCVASSTTPHLSRISPASMSWQFLPRRAVHPNQAWVERQSSTSTGTQPSSWPAMPRHVIFDAVAIGCR